MLRPLCILALLIWMATACCLGYLLFTREPEVRIVSPEIKVVLEEQKKPVAKDPETPLELRHLSDARLTDSARLEALAVCKEVEPLLCDHAEFRCVVRARGRNVYPYVTKHFTKIGWSVRYEKSYGTTLPSFGISDAPHAWIMDLRR